MPELLHGVRISTSATFDINLMTMSNNKCIFYPSELLRYDRQGKPREQIICNKSENLKLCLVAATNGYLKRRAEYKKFFIT